MSVRERRGEERFKNLVVIAMQYLKQNQPLSTATSPESSARKRRAEGTECEDEERAGTSRSGNAAAAVVVEVHRANDDQAGSCSNRNLSQSYAEIL